ncbi:hypothetical protein QM202_09775 [Serratia marcescens]|uniref:hypothetical protein n=1 Tax=Serratia marcescens TaxID=615 RepID=UPI002949B2BA|nr:hypothetical protein [Serratia marcescens]MDV5748027.1 hypothetical protein [Serratia marcescens]
MNSKNIPKISLFNVDKQVEKKLQSNGFNISSHILNGVLSLGGNKGRTNFIQRYTNDVPGDLHESDIIIIDTKNCPPIVDESKAGLDVYFKTAPETIDLMPLDILNIKDNISKNRKTRCVLVFCERYSSESYNIIDKTTMKYESYNSSTLGFDQFFAADLRQGSRYKYEESTENPISKCIIKHSEGLSYNVVFSHLNIPSVTCLKNEGGEVISFYRFYNETIFIFIPSLKNKDLFIEDMLLNVLPDIKILSCLFPNNGSFLWVNNFSYISKEEKDKIEESRYLDEEYSIKKKT